jgi:hypothetical protein
MVELRHKVSRKVKHLGAGRYFLNLQRVVNKKAAYTVEATIDGTARKPVQKICGKTSDDRRNPAFPIFRRQPLRLSLQVQNSN